MNVTLNNEKFDSSQQATIVDKQSKQVLILAAFHKLDKVCYQLGLLNKKTSLAPENIGADQSSNTDLLTLIKELDNFRIQIENQIFQLKKMMTKRCLMILSWEIVILITVSMGLLITSYFFGYWESGYFSPPWLSNLLSRPILITVSSLLLIIGFIIVHYSFRHYFSLKIADTVLNTDNKFTLAKAFLKNCRSIHSIFRPEPVGLHWINRKRLYNVQKFVLSETKLNSVEV